MHGKTSPIFHDDQGVFRGLSNPFEATRYHSLVIKRETFTNPDFVVCAWTQEGEIMGVRHKAWPLHGVQFHPESFLTLEGPKLLRNFVEIGAGR
jgi:anthranilate synthase/aminodeoxychorismate synthase-like glutamine amidotransferase